MKTSLLILFCGLILTSPSAGTDFPPMEGWELKNDYPVYSPDNLWDYINGAAVGYLEFGFEELQMAEYQKGKSSIRVEVYEHKDNAHAFGIYNSERSPSFTFEKYGAHGYLKGSILNFFQGKYYVKLHAGSDKKKDQKAMQELAGLVSVRLGENPGFPKSFSLFPEKNKLPHSESFIAKNFLGHEFMSQVFLCSYKSGEEKYDMFLHQGDSKQDIAKVLEAYYAYTGQDTRELKEGQLIVRDKYNGNIYFLWKDKYLFGLTDVEDADLASSFLSAFE